MVKCPSVLSVLKGDAFENLGIEKPTAGSQVSAALTLFMSFSQEQLYPRNS